MYEWELKSTLDYKRVIEKKFPGYLENQKHRPGFLPIFCISVVILRKTYLRSIFRLEWTARYWELGSLQLVTGKEERRT